MLNLSSQYFSCSATDAHLSETKHNPWQCDFNDFISCISRLSQLIMNSIIHCTYSFIDLSIRIVNIGIKGISITLAKIKEMFFYISTLNCNFIHIGHQNNHQVVNHHHYHYYNACSHYSYQKQGQNQIPSLSQPVY